LSADHVFGRSERLTSFIVTLPFCGVVPPRPNPAAVCGIWATGLNARNASRARLPYGSHTLLAALMFATTLPPRLTALLDGRLAAPRLRADDAPACTLRVAALPCKRPSVSDLRLHATNLSATDAACPERRCRLRDLDRGAVRCGASSVAVDEPMYECTDGHNRASNEQHDSDMEQHLSSLSFAGFGLDLQHSDDLYLRVEDIAPMKLGNSLMLRRSVDEFRFDPREKFHRGRIGIDCIVEEPLLMIRDNVRLHRDLAFLRLMPLTPQPRCRLRDLGDYSAHSSMEATISCQSMLGSSRRTPSGVFAAPNECSAM
jgi:hypothetical protein